ncbi:MAG: hypothetical protein Q9M26_01705 [Mariprofundales bacterium]|nr:hypothetical protein [Mariprofundales bacterium]
MKNSTWLIIICGMVTGMGNGSVFDCAFMLAVGRAPWDTAGLWGMDPYSFMTYQGVVDWIMILFGIAFCLIMQYTLKQHAIIEGQKA